MLVELKSSTEPLGQSKVRSPKEGPLGGLVELVGPAISETRTLLYKRQPPPAKMRK